MTHSLLMTANIPLQYSLRYEVQVCENWPSAGYTDQMRTQDKKALIQAFAEHWFPIAVTIVLLVAVFFVFDLAHIRAIIEASGIWGPLIFIVAKALTIVVAPISGSAIYPMGGALFGFWPGVTYLLLGDALGSTVAFFIARYLGSGAVARMVGKEGGYVAIILEHLNSWKGLIEARIFFAALPEAVAYAAGLSQLPFYKFFIVQMLGAVVPVMILVRFGSLIDMVDNPLILGGFLGMGTIVMLAGGGLFLYHIRRKSALY